jgi:predicted dehydrogenase
MSRRVTRREFIRTTGFAASSILFLPHLAQAKGANDKLNIAIIGAGGRGGACHGAARGQNPVAICDVDEGRLAGAAKSFPESTKKFTDYRKMLEEIKEIDAVMVATADHSHYPASMMALQMGKHVFCEKPLTHTVGEARRLAQVAREKKLATQMGNQGHSSEGNRRLCEYIWAGAIGDIAEVHCWSDRPIWPQGIGRPKGKFDPPKDLDWDLWLGPAPQRPFAPGYHPFNWRGWLDFGTGALGDMGCHIMDGPVWAMKLDQAPTVKIHADHSGMNGETWPNWSIITFEFAAREGMPAAKLVWYDGKKKPRRPEQLEPERTLDSNGSLFLGSKGAMISGTYGGCRIIPETAHRAYAAPPKTIPRSHGMHEDWIEACKGGKPASSNFDVSAKLTEIVLLGCVALLAGKPIEYDLKAGKITNEPDANRFLTKTHRKGFDFSEPVKESAIRR